MNAAVADVEGMFHGEPLDRRALNHMDRDTKLVHIRLEAWGRWVKDNQLHSLPAVTVLARVIEQGITGAGQQGGKLVMPEAVEVTERAVLRLGEIDRRVILEYYTRHAAAEIMARKLHMRVKQFQNVLKRARWRVAGYVAGYEERL